MSNETNNTENVIPGRSQFATFFVGEFQFGIDILAVREINRRLDTYGVPGAPDYVCGVANLRGDVVTTIDLAKLLKIEGDEGEVDHGHRVVITQSLGEAVGLRVDRVGDVVTCDASDIEPPPPNALALDLQVLKGVYKSDGDLIALLDVEELLQLDATGGRVVEV